MPRWDSRPYCHERGKCGARPSHHHRPGWSRHQQCEDSTHRAHWSHHRAGRARAVAVHIDSTGRHGRRQAIRQPSADASFRFIVSHRSTDRSELSRRSAMAERPQNVRPASILERSHTGAGGNRRLIPEARSEDNRIANHSYRGSHRAGSLHHADDQTPAQQRSSRVGRHHAEPTEDLRSRW
jgi:hypothetical protein